MKRRNFLKLTSTLGVATLLPTEVFSMFQAAGITACPDLSNRKIVLIQLAGGNDGLNTLVPLDQYDLYAKLRPTIRLKDSGINSIIKLSNNSLPGKEIGLHPVLTPFMGLYDAGNMHIIQGVGYPKQDKSHFKSSDLWLGGNDGVSKTTEGSGWMGRFIENFYDNIANNDFPLGIEIGSSSNSLGFKCNSDVHNVSLNLSGQNISGFYNVVNGLAGDPPVDIPINSEYGDLIKYVIDNDKNTVKFAKSISDAYDKGKNMATYLDYNLADQLKSVARFISGNLKTKIYLVKIGGFDTHANQIELNQSHKGKHAELLKELADSVSSFMKDLTVQGLADDVVAVTFSEFGRKAAQNDSLGTDHGEIAPMFVFGKAIKAGVSGTNVKLIEAEASNNFQISSIQYDYRNVFATILQNWLGASKTVLNFTFPSFENKFSKISNLIEKEALVNKNCYKKDPSNRLSEANFTAFSVLHVYPNPASYEINFTIDTIDSIKEVLLYNIHGKLEGKYVNLDMSSSFRIDCSNIPVGIYIATIETTKEKISKKILIRR